MASTLAFTYNELIAEIQTTAEDTSAEFVAEMPTIVSAGETRLYGDLNFEIFDRTRTDVLTINVNEQPVKPATWQGTRSVWLEPVGGGARTYLQRRTVEYCQDFQPDPAVNRAQPIYYAELSETEYFMVPSPDVAYPVRIREIGREAALLLTAAAVALHASTADSTDDTDYIRLSRSAEPLRSAFNADVGKVRVLMYVSPT